MNFRPGGIVDASEYRDLIMFYDKTFIMNLKTKTPFASMRAMRPTRQFFHYATKAYEGYIHTPTENLLTWEPMAFTIGLIALVVTIAAWIVR